MRSLLEKAMQTAARAKAQVDELRGTRTATTGATAADSHGFDAHERGVVEHAIARGAPDPFGLLTREQAASVLGAPVGPPARIAGRVLDGVDSEGAMTDHDFEISASSRLWSRVAAEVLL